jgi:hypothetical protein
VIRGDTWLHRPFLLGIISSGLVIDTAAQPKGRRVSGEDTDAQIDLALVLLSYRYRYFEPPENPVDFYSID